MSETKAVPTREEILHILKKNGPQTAGLLAERLGITEMAVRRHLQTLEKDCYVQAERVRQAMGRPTHYYDLTAEAEHLFPKQYVDVSLDFLQTIEEIEGLDKVEWLFKQREERLFQRLHTKMDSLSFADRVAYLAEVQNKKGYMVEYTRLDERTYTLTEYNCPIAEVAKPYQQACSCELSLFKRLLGTERVERTACYAKGDRNCVYQIQQQQQKDGET
jgi:predicted ArsR family transcriptional regulator